MRPDASHQHIPCSQISVNKAGGLKVCHAFDDAECELALGVGVHRVVQPRTLAQIVAQRTVLAEGHNCPADTLGEHADQADKVGCCPACAITAASCMSSSRAALPAPALMSSSATV